MENTKNNRGGVNACLPPSEHKWKLINFCEFDKFAAKSYCAIHHVDESINLGDITQVDEKSLKDFTMMTWGFPCTDISIAGKQQGFIDEKGEKTRSGMYYEGIRILREKKPTLSIIENVKNLTSKKFKVEFETVLKDLEDAGYNNYWKVLNAKDYGIPQNRERVFIISIRKDLDNGNFKFPEPFDNGIRLKDLLEDIVDEKYYVSDEKVQKMIQSMDVTTKEAILRKSICPIDKSYSGSKCRDIANCITSREDRGISTHASEGTAIAENTLHQICHINNSNSVANRVYDAKNIACTLKAEAGGGGGKTGLYWIHATLNSQKGSDQTDNRKVLQIGNVNPSGHEMNGCVYSADGMSPTLTTNKGEGNKVAIAAIRGRYSEDGLIEQKLEISDDDRSHALTSVAKDNVVLVKQATKDGYIECEVGGVADLSFPESKTRRGRVQDGGQTSPTITATETGICKIESSIRVRKLTPRECFRLMGFSDESFDAAQSAGISNSQLYKQAGNSIVVDVLYYIYVELYKAMPYLFDDLRLSSFFSGIGAFEVALDRLYEGINSGNTTVQKDNYIMEDK